MNWPRIVLTVSVLGVISLSLRQVVTTGYPELMTSCKMEKVVDIESLAWENLGEVLRNRRQTQKMDGAELTEIRLARVNGRLAATVLFRFQSDNTEGTVFLAEDCAAVVELTSK